jgi:hypothetical protein
MRRGKVAKRNERRLAAERRREPPHLPQRQRASLEHIFLARYMTNDMIVDLVYKPTTFSWCKADLRNLFDWGYLKKRTVPLNHKDIYFLGLKGRHYIASLGEYARPAVDKVAGVPGGVEPPMDHDLTIARIYTAAVRQCRRYGYQLRWMNTRMLELARLGVQPDGYMRVIGERGAQEAFVEFTDAVPRFSELTDRLRAYRALWEHDRPIPILWFTATRSKLEQLKRLVHPYIYRDYIALACIEDVDCFVTGEVWWDCERRQRVRWITPDERVLYYASQGRSERAVRADGLC